MPLHVYDTRTREKRLFETARTGEVDMYVCGITPYSPSHLGHAPLLHRLLSCSPLAGIEWVDGQFPLNFTEFDEKSS
jgi:Cysteinyl-tRNA synthetase